MSLTECSDCSVVFNNALGKDYNGYHHINQVINTIPISSFLCHMFLLRKSSQYFDCNNSSNFNLNQLFYCGCISSGCSLLLLVFLWNKQTENPKHYCCLIMT